MRDWWCGTDNSPLHGSLFPDRARITPIVVQIEEARYSILILRDIVFLIEVGTS